MERAPKRPRGLLAGATEAATAALGIGQLKGIDEVNLLDRQNQCLRNAVAGRLKDAAPWLTGIAVQFNAHISAIITIDNADAV